jgi:phosphate transport system permease protein
MPPRVTNTIAMIFVWGGGFITVLILLSIIGYVFVQGVHVIDLDFLLTPPKGGLSGEGGISTAIVGTVFLVAVTIVILIPP